MKAGEFTLEESALHKCFGFSREGEASMCETLRRSALALGLSRYDCPIERALNLETA